jgi:GNAT superfamily N-acetyltransferase
VTDDLRAALARVPDAAAWIDTRGMLLSGASLVRFPPGADLERDGFVVVLPARSLVSVVGRPPAALITDAASSTSGDVNVLATVPDTAHVASALRGWRAQTAVLYEAPDMAVVSVADPSTVIFTAADAPSLQHVPDLLRRELLDALEGRPSTRFVSGETPALAGSPAMRGLPMAGVWKDGIPVSFCYPVMQTETLWDVSVDTLEAYRGRGLAGRAAMAMIAWMWRLGKGPVWGALESNEPSRRLARRLGFVEADRITVFSATPDVSPPAPDGSPAPAATR